jgi:hypothetical protein
MIVTLNKYEHALELIQLTLIAKMAQKVKGEKYYASWSSNVTGRRDYLVYLYSNKASHPPIPFPLYYAKLHEYVVKRYSLLDELMGIIERNAEKFAEDYGFLEIPQSSDQLDQLKTLLDENKRRFHDGYEYEINTLVQLFSAPRNFPENEQEGYDQYLYSLQSLIVEIRHNLQEMKFEDLKSGYLLHPKRVHFKEYSYHISKVFEYIHNNNRYSLMDYHLNRLIDVGILPSYIVVKHDPRDIQLALLKALVEITS